MFVFEEDSEKLGEKGSCQSSAPCSEKQRAGGEWAHGGVGRGRNLATPGRAGWAFRKMGPSNMPAVAPSGPRGVSTSLVATCSSHLVVVSLFYGTAIFIYIRPKASYDPTSDPLVSLFYAVVTPILNPIIYSLRNADVKAALKRTIQKMGPAGI